MKQLALFKTNGLGYSKACMKALRLLRFSVETDLPKQRYTANELSKVTGYSVSQMQRCMREMLAGELVDFVAVERKGKPAREWFAK